jgi:hypothetical protein
MAQAIIMVVGGLIDGIGRGGFHRGGAAAPVLSDEEVACALMKARKRFASSVVLSTLSVLLSMACVGLPFWEITSSTAGLDVSFRLPNTVEVCPADSNTGSCSYYTFNSASGSVWPSSSSTSMSSASTASFALILVGIFLSTSVVISSLATSRWLGYATGLVMPSWQHSFDPHIRHRSRHVVKHVLRTPQIPLRFQMVACMCQLLPAILYASEISSFLRSAFPSKTYGTTSSNPNVGYILCAIAAGISVMLFFLLANAADALSRINACRPSYLISVADTGGIIAPSAHHAGYYPMPQQQPSTSVYVAAPGVTQGYAPMPMPMGAQAVAVPPGPADGGYYPTPQGQAMTAPVIQGGAAGAGGYYPQQQYYPPQGVPGGNVVAQQPATFTSYPLP